MALNDQQRGELYTLVLNPPRQQEFLKICLGS
jgi:hypothetical protein